MFQYASLPSLFVTMLPPSGLCSHMKTAVNNQRTYTARFSPYMLPAECETVRRNMFVFFVTNVLVSSKVSFSHFLQATPQIQFRVRRGKLRPPTTHQCFWICGAKVIDLYFEVTELAGEGPNWHQCYFQWLFSSN